LINFALEAFSRLDVVSPPPRHPLV
jgi:hypothetical protein